MPSQPLAPPFAQRLMVIWEEEVRPLLPKLPRRYTRTSLRDKSENWWPAASCTLACRRLPHLR